MTRYAPLWQQAGTYPAGTDRGLLAALWPASGSTGGAAITVANTMQVSIAPGTAAVALGTAGALTQLCRWDAAEVVTLVAAPPAGSSRIDLVVLQVRDNTLDSGGNNDFIFQAIQGAGGTPGPGAVPAVPNNAYAVAQLTVPGGAANLNGVTVVDRRAGLLTGPTPTKCRVYRNAAWTTTNGAVVPFDTVNYDPMGLFSVASSAFRCPVAGDYLVLAAFAGYSTGVQSFVAQIGRSGTAVANGVNAASTAAGQWITTNVADIVTCAAGDTLTIIQVLTSGLNGNTGTNGSFMAVRQIV
jgi:hypothetical protein